MKKVVSGVLMVALFVGMLLGVGYIEHNYTRKDCVVINSTDTGMLIEDGCGFTWYWEGEGYEVGTIVDLKMYDNITSAYVDDDIIKAVVVRGE